MLILACNDDAEDPSDRGGAGDGGRPDASGHDSDAGRGDAGSMSDAGEGDDDDEDGGAPLGCMRAAVGDFELALADDVSIRYGAELTPRIEKTFSVLDVLFERYVPGPGLGTFELGGDGPDGNYGGCAHCLAIAGLAPEYAYFADRGTLVLEADPYLRRLKAKISNLRLVEVEVSLETRASTPIDGGKCIEIDDLEVDAVFPGEGWTCAEERFADGASCDCECGASDPDCEIFFCAPEDTSCPQPLPVADCGATDVCRFGLATETTRCYETCAWGTTACTTGACLFDTGLYGAEVCASGEDEVSSAMLGEQCSERPFTRPCHVVAGHAQGYCDFDRQCRPVCDEDTDCAGELGTSCQPFFTDQPFGYCALAVSSE
jgi:hypothetical protein